MQVQASSPGINGCPPGANVGAVNPLARRAQKDGACWGPRNRPTGSARLSTTCPKMHCGASREPLRLPSPGLGSMAPYGWTC